MDPNPAAVSAQLKKGNVMPIDRSKIREGMYMQRPPCSGGFVVSVERSPGARHPEVKLLKGLPGERPLAHLERLARERAVLAQRLAGLRAQFARVRPK